MPRPRRLSDSALRVLRACAAAGRPLTAQDLLPVVNGSWPRLVDAVGHLEGRFLVRRSVDVVAATRRGRDLLKTSAYRSRS